MPFFMSDERASERERETAHKICATSGFVRKSIHTHLSCLPLTMRNIFKFFPITKSCLVRSKNGSSRSSCSWLIWMRLRPCDLMVFVPRMKSASVQFICHVSKQQQQHQSTDMTYHFIPIAIGICKMAARIFELRAACVHDKSREWRLKTRASQALCAISHHVSSGYRSLNTEKSPKSLIHRTKPDNSRQATIVGNAIWLCHPLIWQFICAVFWPKKHLI